MDQDDGRPGPRDEAEPYRRSEITFDTPVYRPSRQATRRAAQLWREGYGHGFRDALRLAERELPPETWSVLYQLATRHDLAASDVAA